MQQEPSPEEGDSGGARSVGLGTLSQPLHIGVRAGPEDGGWGQGSDLPLLDLVPTGCGSGSKFESVPAKWVGSCLSQRIGLGSAQVSTLVPGATLAFGRAGGPMWGCSIPRPQYAPHSVSAVHHSHGQTTVHTGVFCPASRSSNAYGWSFCCSNGQSPEFAGWRIGFLPQNPGTS